VTARPVSRPRTGARRTLVRAIAAIPRYLRLIGGLIIDGRVELIDKLILLAAAAYAVMPFDLIPDFIPVIGLADDVFLLTLAIRRLISNAGMKVVLDHWTGRPEDLSDWHLELAISAAAFFIPRRIRRRLEKRFRR
jgi:uncharacterized membrane protein YkvA (DUF1232 family)